MNKPVKRLVSFVLTLVMVCSILPPVTIGAANYIIPISTAEEFMAIMDAPDRSYMLTEDLDLGAINPLGYDPGTGEIIPFTGTLDGSGHRITYSVNPSAQLNHYALFAWLDGAEIANLSVHGKLKAELSNGNTSFVGILAGRMDNSTVGGGTFSGSVDVSGSAGWTNIGNIVGFCDSSAQLNRVTARVDTTVNACDDMGVRYYALSYCHDSFAYGSAELTGNIDYATAIYYSFNTRSSQNMTIKPSCESVIRGIYDGEYNTYSAIITVTPQGTGSLTITLDGISDGTANTFEGDLRCSGPTAGSLTACMANGGTGQTVKGNLTISGNGRSYAYGMYECDFSTMEGNISAAHGSKATGLHNCTDCIFNGSIALTAQWNNARVYGANKGEHNQLNCNLSITSGWDNAGVYGLIDCPESSFNGSLSAKGKTRAHAIGACNATHNVVHATIAVDCDAVGSTGGDATGVSSTSSCFEGSISCPGGFVQGCGNDSIAKGSLSGQHVTATGDGSLFTGSIRASAASDMAQPSVSIVGAFRGSVSVTGRDNGACFYPGICFSGSASVSAQDGLISVHALEGTSVSISHGASGVSGTSQSLVDKGDRDDAVEIYWHRYAKEWGCNKDYHPYMDYSYHSYLMECYQNVINVAILENSNPDLSDLGWNGSIDPVLGTYKPELEPASYTIVVTDPKGNAIHSCRISIGGEWLYPDENGAFHIENGSAVISPLVVELQNADSTYTQVLRRTAYFPARNRINTIQLEPTVEQLTVSLVAADAPTNQNNGTWGGIPVRLFRRTVDLFQQATTMSANISNLGIDYKVTNLPNGNIRTDLSFGTDLVDKPLKDVDVKKILGHEVLEVMGISLNYAIIGFSEMALNMETLQWEGVRAELGLSLQGAKRLTYQIPQLACLVYVTGQLGLGGSGTVGMEVTSLDDSVDHVVLRPSGTLSLEGALELAIGIGLRCADVYAEGGGEGKLALTWDLPHRSPKTSVTAKAIFRGFFRSRMYFLGAEKSTPDGEFQLWPRTSGTNALDEVLPMQEDYHVLPRTYLDRLQIQSADDPGSENFYPYSQLQLLKLADGRYAMVYTDDDAGRDDADRSVLRARIGTDTDGQIVWGDAITIENDGTGDYSFSACVSGNEIAVVWQDMDTEFGSGENVDLGSVPSHVELTQAVLDCSGDVPSVSRIAAIPTEDSTCESMPIIFYSGDTLRCAWITATESDPTAIDESTRCILWLCEGFGEDSTVSVVAQDLLFVTGIALLGGDLLWSTYAQTDSSLWLRDSEGSVTCLYESGVSNLQSVGSRYIFTIGDTRYGGYGSYSDCRQEGLGEGNCNLLRLSATGDVCYAELGLTSTRIYRFNGETARPVGEYGGYLTAWDMADDHIVAVLFRDLENNGETATLLTGSVQTLTDVTLELFCDDPTALAGSTVALTAQLTNNGTNALSRPSIRVTAQDGTVLHEESTSITVETGCTAMLGFTFSVPEDFTPQDVTVTIADQSQTIRLGCSNLALAADWTARDASRVHVTVENNGYGDADGTVTLTDSNGSILSEHSVSVAQGGTEELWLEIGSICTEDTVLNVTLTEAEAAAYAADNTATIYILPEQAQMIHVESHLYVCVGMQQSAPVHAFPSGALLPELEYSTEDPEIALVDPSGVVTGVAVGETILTVTETDGTAHTVTVRVTENSGEHEPDDPVNPFTDVEPGSFYYDPVMWAVANGITNGTSTTTFGPNDQCMRAHVVTFLWRAVGCPEPTGSGNPFVDVKETDFYYKPVLWALENGITSGMDATHFGPTSYCNRAQVVTFLYRTMGNPAVSATESPFADVPAGQWYTAPVLWAVENGITNGLSPTTFGPNAICNRAQIVTFLYRAFVD